MNTRRHYQYASIPARASKDRETADTEAPIERPTEFPRIYMPRQAKAVILLTMGGCGLLLLLLQLVIIPWWQGITDQWEYGTSRTFQLDGVVGHQDSTAHPTHFLAFDLHGRVIVIEIPGGDTTKTRIYAGGALIGSGDKEHRVITLEIRDVNADGKPDLIIHIEGVTTAQVMYNNGTAFQWNEP